MIRLRIATLIIGALLALVSVSFGGVGDSPLPVLAPGATTYHVYSVPGVMRSAGDTTATFFQCTSLETTATIQLGVEVFDRFGLAENDPVATSVSIVPGETILISTGPLIIGGGFDPNVYLSLPGTWPRSARILATSKKIMCTAFVADPSNLPPTVMTYLPMIAKTKQKAFN